MFPGSGNRNREEFAEVIVGKSQMKKRSEEYDNKETVTAKSMSI